MDVSSDYTTYDDEKLIRLIAQSQEEALTQLYERYHRLVFSLALAIVDDRATAEEITVDVFARVWQKADTYRADQARVSTWLTHIARHHAIDVLRHRAARPDHQALHWEEISSDGKSFEADPQESAELSLRRKRVHAALAQLPADQKQAMLLAYFGGYTQRQIAEALGQPLGTVKTRLRLAMQKLRDLLRDEQEFQDTSVELPTTYNVNEE
jgi:RNA polymerase sigma-70 factor (ECF subfamily)